MPIRTANAEWHSDLAKGSGHMRLGSGTFEGSYDFRSRMGDALIGAAHAGCFSMALAHELAQAGFTVERIRTAAKVHFSQDTARGWSIPLIELVAEANVPGIATAAFAEHAQRAKELCPVSRALASIDIRLTATLERRHSNGAEREL